MSWLSGPPSGKKKYLRMPLDEGKQWPPGPLGHLAADQNYAAKINVIC
jgi:hypothetical protein